MTQNPSKHPPTTRALLAETLATLLAPLVTPFDDSDPINECGSAPLSILRTRPYPVQRLAHDRLHAFPFKDVPVCWRRLYCEAALWIGVEILRGTVEAEGGGGSGEQEREQEHGIDRGRTVLDVGQTGKGEGKDWLTRLVEVLDMALILTGAPLRSALIENVLGLLHGFVEPGGEGLGSTTPGDEDPVPAAKRRKLSPANVPAPSTIPPLTHPIPRTANPSLPSFQVHLTTSHARNDHRGPLPLIITSSLTHWPALTSRPWSNTEYLLSRTLGGRRLVPVELGRSYTDTNWGQQIMPFRQFLHEHMSPAPSPPPRRQRTGYLAQHDLFAQIPALRADIAVPDYCYSAPPPPAPGHLDDDDESTPLSPVLLHAWFGPAHTISPLHTDPHHNILAQVVGTKYVRLYAPTQSAKLYPQGGGGGGGVDMSNTSRVDVGEALRARAWTGWDAFDDDDDDDDDSDSSSSAGAGARQTEDDNDNDNDNDTAAYRARLESRFPGFLDAEYVDGLLAPGECLYIPRGWWHYVRSLTPSFSVSFWWD
jgi:Cupin-like domain